VAGHRPLTGLTPDSGGATPLTAAELQGLRLPLLTRSELNLAEAQNIGSAVSWVFSRRLRPDSVTSEAWLTNLHKMMYGDVWTWAGQYRTTERNLGVPHWQIRVDMRNLEADVRAWLADTTSGRHGEDECAVRFGHRLVLIHPFPTGNGRWSRLAADALIVALGGRRFTWGQTTLTEPGRLRRDYVAALRLADTDRDFAALIAFARS
jgi:Fic-DOC domain mobile mystery protein B